jgi:DHA2 family multidrug resistance protein-like MFS transporter
VAGLAVAAVFVGRQRALADPLVDLGLFRAPAFSAALATNTHSFFVVFGAELFLAQYLQLVLGLSALAAGLLMVPSALGFVAGTMLTPALVRWIRPGHLMAGGLVIAAVGFGVLTQVSGGSGLAVVVGGSVVLSLGVSPVFTLAADLMVGGAPAERAGAASGISETSSETSSEFGGALGIAVLGSIGTAVYRGGIADTVPAGVPPEFAEAARDSLGGALEVAGRLPAEAGAALFAAASEAFTQGLQLVAAASTGLAAVIAVLAAVMLRRLPPNPEAETPAEAEPEPEPLTGKAA